MGINQKHISPRGTGLGAVNRIYKTFRPDCVAEWLWNFATEPMKVRYLALLFTLVFVAGCDGNRKVQIHGSTMGTYYRIVSYCHEAPIQREIEDRLDTLNNVFSNWLPDSRVSQFNQAIPTLWMPVERELAEVVEAAKEFSFLFNSKFDVTILPVLELWGFSTATVTKKPTDAEIERALLLVDHKQLEVQRNPPALRKNLPLRIDLSGIAKGYGVDQLAEQMEEAGCMNYLIDIGGEIRVNGRNEQGELWRIAIEYPDGSGDVMMNEAAAYSMLRLTSGAVATSGEYRNVRYYGDERVTHIIDPTNGRPVEHNVTSITVYASTAMDADALATGLFVLGEGAIAFAEANGIAMIMFTWSDDLQQHEMTVSPSMEIILEPMMY